MYSSAVHTSHFSLLSCPLFLVRTLPMHVPCSFPLFAQSLLSSFFATHPWIRSYALCFCSCPFPFATHALVPSYTPFPLHMHCGYLFHRCQRPSTFPCPFMLLMRCAYSFYFLAFSTRSSHIPKPILSVHALRIFFLFPTRSNHTHITVSFFFSSFTMRISILLVTHAIACYHTPFLFIGCTVISFLVPLLHTQRSVLHNLLAPYRTLILF